MIVLTGGAGFIGSVMLWRLNNAGIHDIVVVDRMHTSAKWKNLLGKRFRYLASPEEFLTDLRKGTYQGIEAILHFGARTNTTEQDLDFLVENNYRFSVQLAEYALELGVPFIYASSASVYGDGSQGYDDTTMPTMLRPLNPYAFSKYLFDLWVHEHNASQKVTGLRFFNVYGPNEYHKGEMASMVYKAFIQIQRTGKVHLFESTTPEFSHGEQKRDFIYVHDVVEVVWQILLSYHWMHPVCGIYNLGSGTARSWNDLAYAVFAALGREPHIAYIPMPDALRSQYQNFTQANLRALEQALSYHNIQPSFTTLEEGVRQYVQEYLLRSWHYL